MRGPRRRAFTQEGAIDPLSLPNHELSFLSTVVAGTEGDRLAGWSELANARDLAQAVAGAKPVLRTTTNLSPNGSRLVEFDSQAREMTGPLPVGPMTNVRGFTLYTAFRLNAITGTAVGQIIFYTPTGTPLGLFVNATTDWGFPLNGFPGFEATSRYQSASATATGWQKMTLLCPAPSGSSATLYRNGIAIATGNWACAFGTDFKVGGYAGNGGARAGIGAVDLFTDTHSPATMLGVNAYYDSVFGT